MPQVQACTAYAGWGSGAAAVGGAGVEAGRGATAAVARRNRRDDGAAVVNIVA